MGSRPVYGALDQAHYFSLSFTGDYAMQWTTPQFTDLRFGFEITMYIATR
jgi:coenzyme PQQ precursor peptide PqqA